MGEITGCRVRIDLTVAEDEGEEEEEEEGGEEEDSVSRAIARGEWTGLPGQWQAAKVGPRTQ